MLNDLVADSITRIRNGQMAYLPKVSLRYSKQVAGMCDVLKREGYIREYEVKDVRAGIKDIEVQLKYVDGQAVIKKIKRESRSGQRRYSSIGALPKYYNGLGIAILSTPKGIISDYEARQQHVGGEILCSVF